MTNRNAVFAATLVLLASSLVSAVAQDQANTPPAPNSAGSPSQQVAALSAPASSPPALTDKSASPHEDSAASGIHNNRTLRLEGEKRFQANCGRCHMAPPKFPPRAMATILRHMRVRALITDEDRRFILRYMTE
ncbi:MAG TPA: cytochrome c [Candidatus Acidoferrum sp.]